MTYLEFLGSKPQNVGISVVTIRNFSESGVGSRDPACHPLPAPMEEGKLSVHMLLHCQSVNRNYFFLKKIVDIPFSGLGPLPSWRSRYGPYPDRLMTLRSMGKHSIGCYITSGYWYRGHRLTSK